MRDDDRFYEFVYRTFYGFAEAKPEDIGLVVSRDIFPYNPDSPLSVEEVA